MNFTAINLTATKDFFKIYNTPCLKFFTIRNFNKMTTDATGHLFQVNNVLYFLLTELKFKVATLFRKTNKTD